MRCFLVAVLVIALPAASSAQLQSSVFASGFSLPVAFVQDPAQPGVQYVVEQAGRVAGPGDHSDAVPLRLREQLDRGLLVEQAERHLEGRDLGMPIEPDGVIRGIGGDADSLAAVAKAYRVYYKKVPLKDGDYTMDHTAIVYLMDKDGRFVAPFSLKRRPEDAAADLRRYF